MATRKIRGKTITTSQENQEIIDDSNESTVILLESLSLENLTDKDIHCRINKGDEILILAKERIKIEGLEIDSVIIKEAGSIVRYMGIE